MNFSEMLLIIRQNLISILKKYELILLPIIRFIISFSVLQMLKEATHYTGALSGLLVISALSLIGAFASAQLIEICSIFLVIIFVAPSNPIMAVILFIILSMIYILYGRIFPKESMLVIVTMVAFSIKMELAVPIIGALVGSYISVVAIMIGIIIWFMIPKLQMIVPSTGLDKAELVDALTQLLAADFKALVSDQMMMVMLVVCFIVFTCIYLIKKLSIDYGAYIAIVIGAVMNILGFGLGEVFLLDSHINFVRVSIETIGISLVAVVIQFLSIALDYQRAETVNFEDDDNYYYVKIIPKIKLNSKHKKEKKVYTDLAHTSYDSNQIRNYEDFEHNL